MVWRQDLETIDAMASSQPTKPALTTQVQRAAQPGLRYPSNGSKTIYHRPLNRSRTQELSQASFAYLFGEMVSYAQKRVTGIQDLEKRYVNKNDSLYLYSAALMDYEADTI